MLDAPYFRPGAGAVIFNAKREILIFKRVNSPGWQFPQGGMDRSESPEATLWRELFEETGLQKSDFLQVHEYPDWTIYAYPEETIATLPYKDTLGQAHRWFFLELKPEKLIDLNEAPDKEFSDWRWSTFPEIIASIIPMKRHIYIALGAYFNQTNFDSLRKLGEGTH